jgi:uncharacterized protein YdiU (UPF0061 family)
METSSAVCAFLRAPMWDPGDNWRLATKPGLDSDALKSEHGVAVLAGTRVAEVAEPVAQAYAGHQFGHFVSQLGDGV